MKFFLTCPSLAPHGGVRVLLEWANWLQRRGHTVVLRTPDRRPLGWFQLHPDVQLARSDVEFRRSDCVIVGSPHGTDYLEVAPRKAFAFMQMAEHLFRPHDKAWQKQCRRFYLTRHPLLAISRWNMTHVSCLGREGPTFYVDNGVNLGHFPIRLPPKDGRTVLVEGWQPGNPTKDLDRLAARVAKRLRAQGCRILAYGMQRLNGDRWSDVPNEYYPSPSLATLNALYERATILLKATHCDARSCAPMEAMTKGTVTARAIDQGDDDLEHGVNCLRSAYSGPDAENELYDNAWRLLRDAQLRQGLADACVAHVRRLEWDAVLAPVEELLCRP